MIMPAKGTRGYGGTPSIKIVTTLGFTSFCVGALIIMWMWHTQDIDADGDADLDYQGGAASLRSEFSAINEAIQDLNERILSLNMEVASGHRENYEQPTVPGTQGLGHTSKVTRQKAFVVVGINTGFEGQKKRDAIRSTWKPKGDKLRRLEDEKGIVIRFIIGRSTSFSSLPDLRIDAENAQHEDILRLDHIEGYSKLSAKTKIYISTAFAMWDADFYLKVDDDVHVNLGALATTLAQHVSKPRVYTGCMKSGRPVLREKSVKHYEPEFWKFGEEGSKYFEHATGKMYAISKDLADYISENHPILHEYANDDVSLGSWLLGLDVEHIDDRSMCCGALPDCALKAKAGNLCVASFDWTCNGICDIGHMKKVHRRCGEGEGATLQFNMTLPDN